MILPKDLLKLSEKAQNVEEAVLHECARIAAKHTNAPTPTARRITGFFDRKFLKLTDGG